MAWGRGPSTSSKRPPGPDRSQMLVGANSFALTPCPIFLFLRRVAPVLGGDDRGRSAMKMGDTPVSCRKDGRGDFVTVADAIDLLRHKFPSYFPPMNANGSELI
jgi:hypothetical protein